jgi:hypothetical protein
VISDFTQLTGTELAESEPKADESEFFLELRRLDLSFDGWTDRIEDCIVLRCRKLNFPCCSS